MITTIVLANTSIRSHYYFFLMVRICKMQSLNNFVYNTVLLTRISMLCIRSLKLIHLLGASLYGLTASPQFHQSQPWQPPFCSLFLGVQHIQIPHTNNTLQYLSFFLAYLTQHNTLKVCPCFANGRIFFFLIVEYIYIKHIFTHLLTVSQVVNAAVNMGVPIFFNILFSFSLDVYPELGLLDHIVLLFSIFCGNSTLFTTVAEPIYIPTNSA